MPGSSAPNATSARRQLVREIQTLRRLSGLCDAGGHVSAPDPRAHREPAAGRETCEQCHWPRKFFGEVETGFPPLPARRTNSPWTIRMLVKIGGGDPSFGPVGGIHWHMAIANKIEYVAGDKARQVIPWVRLTDRTGKSRCISPPTIRSNPSSRRRPPRVMDCMDCHNRPTHIYHSPVDSMDPALCTGGWPACSRT